MSVKLLTVLFIKNKNKRNESPPIADKTKAIDNIKVNGF